MVSNEAVLVVGHGSRLDFNRETVYYHAKNLQDLGYSMIEVGFNEKCEPTIEDAMGKLLDSGADVVYVVPVFIASGIHITRDIPAKIGLAAGERTCVIEHQGRSVTVRYCDSLGQDDRVAQIMATRIEETRAS